MLIQLCKKGLDRLGAGGSGFISSLREREHQPVIKDCLDRCQGCDRGLLIANADGIPLSAATAEKLLASLDDLGD